MILGLMFEMSKNNRPKTCKITFKAIEKFILVSLALLIFLYGLTFGKKLSYDCLRSIAIFFGLIAAVVLAFDLADTYQNSLFSEIFNVGM